MVLNTGVKNPKFKSDPNFLKLTYVIEIHNLRFAQPFWFRPYCLKYGQYFGNRACSGKEKKVIAQKCSGMWIFIYKFFGNNFFGTLFTEK